MHRNIGKRNESDDASCPLMSVKLHHCFSDEFTHFLDYRSEPRNTHELWTLAWGLKLIKKHDFVFREKLHQFSQFWQSMRKVKNFFKSSRRFSIQLQRVHFAILAMCSKTVPSRGSQTSRAKIPLGVGPAEQQGSSPCGAARYSTLSNLKCIKIIKKRRIHLAENNMSF